MADIKQLETTLQAIRSGLTVADLVAGWAGRLRTPERRAQYARWRALRLELRAVRARVRGKTGRALVLMEKSQVWSGEAQRLELAIPKTNG
jgi:hypothetical protein